MRFISFTLLPLLFLFNSFAQKPSIELDSYKNWKEVSGGVISDDGNYMSYNVSNLSSKITSTIVRSTKTKWQREYLNFSMPKFDETGIFFLGKLNGDTLIILNLRNKIERRIMKVENFQFIQYHGKSNILCSNDETVSVINLEGERLKTFDSILQFQISPSGKSMIIEQNLSRKKVLSFVDFITGSMSLIGSGLNTSDFIYDNPEEKIAFICSDNSGDCIYLFDIEKSETKKLVTKSSRGIDSGLSIIRGPNYKFSSDSKSFFFSVREESNEIANKRKSFALEIWNYKDAYLKSNYYDYGDPNFVYPCVVNLKTGEALQLLHGIERTYGEFGQKSNSLFIGINSFGDLDESWNFSSRISYFVCNAQTGERFFLAKDCNKELGEIRISPSGKYVIYYESNDRAYYTLDIKSRVKQKILGVDVNGLISFNMKYYPPSETIPLGCLGWIDDENVLLQGTYDIWKVNILNKVEPINITKGLGQKTNSVFNILRSDNYESIDTNKILVLGALDLNTKNYSIYTIKLNQSSNPILKSTAQRYMEQVKTVYGLTPPHAMIKAKKSKSFIFRWQKFDSAPNYYYTDNLIEFKEMSNVQPQRKYNWLTSELHTYNDSLGNEYQGVLYKPENFDPNKKYPVIFNIYFLQSNILNMFPDIRLSSGECTISHLVSNGYLIFLPDIKLTKFNAPGEITMLSINAALDHLKKYSWVNQNKLGVSGSSTGGYETNYLITHSNHFAAALSMAGVSDLVMQTTTLRGGYAPISNMKGYFIDSIMPSNPNIYYENSPILYSKFVTTPLLLVHNSNDGAVDYHHSQAFFIALRALNKPVWWLNYKNEGHGFGGLDIRYDFHKKAIEFWDYFLKDKSEPEWMSNYLSPINR